jgi:hypothetical protein
MLPFGAASLTAFGPLKWVGAELNHQRAAKRRIRDQ